ncbi:MAG: ATP-binding protein [Kofleriaceae bacterium]
MSDRSPLESVRKHPGMYVGDPDDGSGAMHLLLDIIANSFDQYLAGRCTRIDIEVEADGCVCVTDDGPGMSIDATDGRPGLHEILTTMSDRPTVDGHRPHAHLGIGGIGLFVVNALSERFEITTVHEGQRSRALYSRGLVVEELSTTTATSGSGTTIRYLPDSQIFPHARIPRAMLTSTLEDLAFLAPSLTLSWRIAGDSLARAGLAGRVAALLACPVEEVAHYSGTFETPTGPIDVDVALAWKPKSYRVETSIDSFVNLFRTREHGAHVEGLLDGICQFFKIRSRRHVQRELVAAVSVVLSDVKLGNPQKNRLDSLEACDPVAEATRRALEAWATAHPGKVAAARAHMTERA